jgi:glucosamine-6-phosphate deaminase
VSKVIHHADVETATLAIAKECHELAMNGREDGSRCVFGLATGNTMASVYKAWANLALENSMHPQTQGFNLDEFWPLAEAGEQSFGAFMNEHFRGPLGLSEDLFRVPACPAGLDPVDFCQSWEAAIQNAGGIDLQLLGIGANGHIGFNEPGSPSSSRTRLVDLAETTRLRAGFGGDSAPRQAITAGIATILKAKKILVFAYGEDKADAIRKALHEPPHSDCPASYLQNHPNVVWHLAAY